VAVVTEPAATSDERPRVATGRAVRDPKRLVNECLQLDLAQLRRRGQLLDVQGVPKTGTVNIQIRIYEMMAPVAGETALFTEDHENVALDNGIFSIRIGTGMPVSGTFGPELFNATNRYLQVHINGEIVLAMEDALDTPLFLLLGEKN